MKKKILLAAVCCFAFAINASAQSWYAVVHNSDGTVDSIPASNLTVNSAQTTMSVSGDGVDSKSFQITGIDSVTFGIPNKNVDQLIIKELYAGGCMKDDGTTKFQRDKGCILYNNCADTIVVNNLCFGMGNANAQASSAKKNYDSAGNFVPDTFAIPFQPTWAMIWWIPKSLVIAPYSQVVISFMGSIDNTQTISNSVNYANKDYYCMYDPEAGWTSDMSTSHYPTPADVIPVSHYLKGNMFSQGSAWAFSVTSPSFFIYTLDMDPVEFANNSDYDWYTPGYVNSLSFKCKQVPQSKVIDGIEVYSSNYDVSSQYKRLSSKIDAGYVMMTNYAGHSLYRNVDKEATLEIEGNADLLVYGYDSDPSGIDAEASIKKGAKIVYVDTNNSTNDFHERSSFSIKE